MDGLSAAGGIVSLVGLVGQLVQSVEALYQFWSCVKDVPTHLQWLVEDLRLLQAILASITQQSVEGLSTVGATMVPQALRSCAVHLSNLEELIAPLQSQSRETKCRAF